jgi:hypothetical protein
MPELGGGARRRRLSKKTVSRRSSRLPRTSKQRSKKTDYKIRRRFSRASSGMSITDLQFLAKSRGIPFGGLSMTKLIRKINNY